VNNTNKFKVFYLLGYGALGVMNPLISQYLSSIGFSGTQIGTVTSAATAAAVFASAFLGKLYANSRDGRKFIALICIAAAAMGLVNTMITPFMLFLATYSVQYFFQGPVMGIADALVLEKENENFSVIRLCGAAGYAVSVFAGGKAGGAIGLVSIFYIFSVLFLLAAAAMMTTDRVSGRSGAPAEGTKSKNGNRDKEEKQGYGRLFHEKRAIQLIICGIFIIGSNFANNTYFSFLFREGGGTIAGVGTVFLLMVGSEAPCMALTPKVCKIFSREKTILAAFVLSTLRFGVYALGPSYQFLMATFFVQGMVNGVILTEYIKYLSSVVKPELIGLTVAAYYAVSSNGGTILCSFFGGIAMDWMGSTGVYGLFCILNVIGTALYLMFGLHKGKSEKKAF